MANYIVSDMNLTAIADAIRDKGGTVEQLSFPSGMTAAIAALQTGAEPNNKTYAQRNTVAASYIDSVTYSASDYTVSYIADYANTTTDYAKSKPFGVTINLPAGELIIIDSNGGLLRQTISAGNHTIYNVTPSANGGDYYVVNDGVITAYGHLTASGSLRMIYNDAELFRNCRDLGGWSCDGGTVKYGLLFRGNDPFGKITDTDRQMWTDFIKLKKEISIQSAEELGDRTASAFGDSVDFYKYDITYGTLEDWKDNGGTKAVLNELFDYAINGQPSYFHCIAGADRTGYLSLLIEAIIGVSQSDCDKDYELTCFSTGANTDDAARRRNEGDWTSRINYLNTFTGATFRDKVVNYLLQCGITIEQINAFRTAMIDGTPATLTDSLNTFTIAKTLNNSAADNSDTTIKQYREYAAEITPNTGYVIDSVTVTMNGVNITNQVLDGDFVTNGEFEITANGEHNIKDYSVVNVNVSGGGTQYSVTKTLNNSTANNTQTQAVANQSFGMIITADENYQIDSVSVTVNGVAVSADNILLIEGE